MARVQVITYGIENKTSDFVATKISQSIDGVFFSLFNRKKGDFKKYMIRMLGDFNIYNAMIAIMIANILNINDKHIHKTLKNVITPIGRMEIMQKNPFVVIVDFAHNPFSLMTSLNNLITIKQSPFSKIITVFGCPGLRDKSRRTMGKVSAELSDITIITADDPRTEKVEDINNEIAIWADKAGAKEIHILIGSPEIHHPCYMGIDMKSENEFIMNTFNPAELAMEIGADSITFLELDKLRDAIGKKGLCTACWTGEYPKELEW
ncbi:hypothetical protein LCGC14_2541220 [marine sediment metagenome]|uniref:Mur ligase C-terminal domain-containing protein n=1 Tax=marine sediment metagenome TaxID=412755 RepID=A0A0F9AQP2_9ZZZZ